MTPLPQTLRRLKALSPWPWQKPTKPMNSPAFLLNSDWSRPTLILPTTTTPISGKPPLATFATTAMANSTMCTPCATSTVLISSACLWTLAHTVESGIGQQPQLLAMPFLLCSGIVPRDTIPLLTRLGTTWAATMIWPMPAEIPAEATMGTRILRHNSVRSCPMTAVLAVLVSNTSRVPNLLYNGKLLGSATANNVALIKSNLAAYANYRQLLLPPLLLHPPHQLLPRHPFMALTPAPTSAVAGPTAAPSSTQSCMTMLLTGGIRGWRWKHDRHQRLDGCVCY